LDEVINEPNLPNQQTDLRGLFFVPNTGSSTRYRFVPLTDAVGGLRTLHLSGLRTLRATAVTANDDVQLNYFLFVPASGATGLPWVSFASPGPNDSNVD